MDPASFAAGLALGILATCAGSTLVVWRLIRRAPVIDYNAEDPAVTAEVERYKVRPIPADVLIGGVVAGAVYEITEDGQCEQPGPERAADIGAMFDRWRRAHHEITLRPHVRGPVTYYPPHTPPLIDIETWSAADEYAETGWVQPLPGLRLPRCEYVAMGRRCAQAHPHQHPHVLKAERTLHRG